MAVPHEDYPVADLETPLPYGAGTDSYEFHSDVELEVLQALQTSEEPSERSEEYSDDAGDYKSSKARSLKNIFSYRSFTGDLSALSEEELGVILRAAGVSREEIENEDALKETLRRWLMPAIDYKPTFARLMEPENKALLAKMLAGDRPVIKRSKRCHTPSLAKNGISYRYRKLLRSFHSTEIMDRLIVLLAQYVDRLCSSLPLPDTIAEKSFSCSSKVMGKHEALSFKFDRPVGRKICHALSSFYGFLTSHSVVTEEGRVLILSYNQRYKLEKPKQELNDYLPLFIR
eukprot:TRINITY_DN5597_c0_g2_i1.p1 TRINITY_DN5597_c0_g2~~TRINITY_DN5597_c0_g2_i1.p1  ORF type:complete len:288 (+),score=-12.44 TRINITY_DN5597_c0_g2_i1:29-892(+)